MWNAIPNHFKKAFIYEFLEKMVEAFDITLPSLNNDNLQ